MGRSVNLIGLVFNMEVLEKGKRKGSGKPSDYWSEWIRCSGFRLTHRRRFNYRTFHYGVHWRLDSIAIGTEGGWLFRFLWNLSFPHQHFLLVSVAKKHALTRGRIRIDYRARYLRSCLRFAWAMPTMLMVVWVSRNASVASCLIKALMPPG